MSFFFYSKAARQNLAIESLGLELAIVNGRNYTMNNSELRDSLKENCFRLVWMCYIERAPKNLYIELLMFDLA